MKRTTAISSKNVLDAANERIDLVFSEFDNIIVAFSGGKDSGVLLNLAIDAAKRAGRRISVLHLDYEAQYSATTEYVDQVFKDLGDSVDAFRCCVPFKVTTCTSMHQTFWRPWDPKMRDMWVRKLPQHHYTAENFDYFTTVMWDYDFQERFSLWHHERTGAKRTCVLIGIRAEESLDRWRTIVSEKRTNHFNSIPWTTKVYPGVFNAYPIYDWKVEDVWTANAKFGWSYNRLYDLFHLAGVSIHQMRVASPFLGTAKSSLHLYRAIDPDVWGRMVSRVNGVNCTAIYGDTTAMGWKNITKPKHFSWREYAEFLLDTLPDDAAENYRKKLATSIKFWSEKGGCLDKKAQEDLRKAGIKFDVGEASNYRTSKLPVRMDYADDIDSADFRLIPTWKRLCVCIMKNDHVGKYMGFSLTKQEMQRRESAIAKYKDL